jgi:hypothetical protein
MPAIQPARLKRQASELAGKFDQPAWFVRDLHSLLDLYTDHTHRPGQAGEPSSLIDTYKTPPPVMRQIWNELIPLVNQHPADVLPLCDALWSEQNYDLKMLAARLLGQVPANPPNPVVDRLNSWICQDLDNRILDGVFEYGLMHLQQDTPGVLLDLVSYWMGSADHPLQHAGLRALLPMINQSGTENLPSIFRMLTPYLRLAPSILRPDILSVLTALARNSPSETAYLLRQNLSAPENPDTAWLIRRVINEFPEEAQAGLRAALAGKR